MATFQKQKKRIKQFISNYKLTHPCVDCGETNINKLTFDHVRGIKNAVVSKLSKRTLSIKKIKDEIDKCEIRCLKCHRKRHNNV